jgi:hypothetical protein
VFPGGTVQSPACFIHDKMYAYARPILDDWFQSNRVFILNMINAVLAQQPMVVGNLKDNGDLYRAVTYYTAVDASPAAFWRKKKSQELI